MGIGHSVRKLPRLRLGDIAGSVVAGPLVSGWIAFSKALENRYSNAANSSSAPAAVSNASLQAALPWASY